MVEGTILLMGWKWWGKVQSKRLGWKQDFSKQPFYVIFIFENKYSTHKNKIKAIKKLSLQMLTSSIRLTYLGVQLFTLTQWLQKMAFREVSWVAIPDSENWHLKEFLVRY